MVRGLYTATLGMTTQQKKMDTVTNNLSNVDTTAYKKDGVVQQSFTEAYMKCVNGETTPYTFSNEKTLGNIGMGLFVDSVYTDFGNGTLQVTDGPLDLSIREEGYFSVRVPNDNGESTTLYTRDGAFTRDFEGYLINKAGYRIQGEGGDILLPEGSIVIGQDGSITVNDEYVDTLQMISVNDNSTLRKQGENLYDVTAETQIEAFSGSVVQGALELSNVNSVQEMVDMITLSRTYEANQTMITTCDSTLDKAVNQIAARA